MHHPYIAIIDENTLAAIGLSGILKAMMPGVETCLFPTCESLRQEKAVRFHHLFVSTRALTEDAAYILAARVPTIVLVHGTETGQLPVGLPTLNVCCEENELVRSILRLARQSHESRGVDPMPPSAPTVGLLSPRETQVLRGVVLGKLNKEIAHDLGVSTATIISHRKNITEKLHQKSVSALTIYAVMHGIVRAEEI